MDYVKGVRQKIGHQALILTAVNLIIYDSENKYYFQKKHNGKLAFVGGFVELNESITDGLVREAREEIALDVDLQKIQLFGIYSNRIMEYPNGDKVKPHSLFFKYKINDERIRPLPPETLDIVVCDLEEGLEMINPQHQEVLTDLMLPHEQVILK